MSVRFAKVVFIAAGVWGIVVLTPLYFLLDMTVDVSTLRRRTYPQFVYGFLSVAMAWQIAFLMIGTSPVRFRPLMIPSMVEKFGHVMTVAVLYAPARASRQLDAIGCRARPAAGRALHRRVCEDLDIGPASRLTRHEIVRWNHPPEHHDRSASPHSSWTCARASSVRETVGSLCRSSPSRSCGRCSSGPARS